MGHFSKRSYEGQRPGSVKAKINKEITRGRMPRNSAVLQSRDDRIERLDSLQRLISRETDPKALEPLHLAFANAAASCPHEVFQPDEISGIIKQSALSDPAVVAGLVRAENYFPGKRPDFLPLNHLVKIIQRRPSQNPNDKDRYVYLLNAGRQSDCLSVPAQNLRALERLMMSVTNRILPGGTIELEINQSVLSLPYIANPSVSDSNPFLRILRHELSKGGVGPDEEYILRRIKIGRAHVSAILYLSSQHKPYAEKDVNGVAVLSYLRTL